MSQLGAVSVNSAMSPATQVSITLAHQNEVDGIGAVLRAIGRPLDPPSDWQPPTFSACIDREGPALARRCTAMAPAPSRNSRRTCAFRVASGWSAAAIKVRLGTADAIRRKHFDKIG